jgi:hypothetical protein
MLARAWRRWSQLNRRVRLVHDDHLPRWQVPKAAQQWRGRAKQASRCPLTAGSLSEAAHDLLRAQSTLLSSDGDGVPQAACAEPCRISASMVSAPAPGRLRLDGGHRPGSVHVRCGSPSPGAGRLATRRGDGPGWGPDALWIDGAAGEQAGDANLGHGSVMVERPCAVPSPVDLPAVRAPLEAAPVGSALDGRLEHTERKARR